MSCAKFGDSITTYSEVRDVNTNKAPPPTEKQSPLALPSLKYKAQKMIPRKKNLKYRKLPLIIVFDR